jgi:hypothetical protein
VLQVTLLMSSQAAVTGLLSLALNVSPAKLEPLLEGLMKLASSPKFAQQVNHCQLCCELFSAKILNLSSNLCTVRAESIVFKTHEPLS